MIGQPFRLLLALLVASFLFVGCEAALGESLDSPSALTAPQHYGGPTVGNRMATGDAEPGAVFAEWVAQQDSNGVYYSDIVVRGEQAMGVRFQPSVTKAEAQRVLVSLTDGMVRAFPGHTLKVTAFYQSGDKLAESVYHPETSNAEIRFEQ